MSHVSKIRRPGPLNLVRGSASFRQNSRHAHDLSRASRLEAYDPRAHQRLQQLAVRTLRGLSVRVGDARLRRVHGDLGAHERRCEQRVRPDARARGEWAIRVAQPHLLPERRTISHEGRIHYVQAAEGAQGAGELWDSGGSSMWVNGSAGVGVGEPILMHGGRVHGHLPMWSQRLARGTKASECLLVLDIDNEDAILLGRCAVRWHDAGRFEGGVGGRLPRPRKQLRCTGRTR